MDLIGFLRFYGSGGTVEDSGARKFAINLATCGARLDALKEEMVRS